MPSPSKAQRKFYVLASQGKSARASAEKSRHVISLAKALSSEYGGTTRSGPSGPGTVTQSMPDYSIYYAPPEKGTQRREQEAARNRQEAAREKHRGFWGPAPKVSPELRYAGQDIAPYVERGAKLGATRETAAAPKRQVERLKAAQKPYEEDTEEESDASRKRKRSRKLVVRRK